MSCRDWLARSRKRLFSPTTLKRLSVFSLLQAAINSRHKIGRLKTALNISALILQSISNFAHYYKRAIFRMATFGVAREDEDECVARIIYHAFRMAWSASTPSNTYIV